MIFVILRTDRNVYTLFRPSVISQYHTWEYFSLEIKINRTQIMHPSGKTFELVIFVMLWTDKIQHTCLYTRNPSQYHNITHGNILVWRYRINVKSCSPPLTGRVGVEFVALWHVWYCGGATPCYACASIRNSLLPSGAADR